MKLYNMRKKDDTIGHYNIISMISPAKINNVMDKIRQTTIIYTKHRMENKRLSNMNLILFTFNVLCLNDTILSVDQNK